MDVEVWMRMHPCMWRCGCACNHGCGGVDAHATMHVEVWMRMHPCVSRCGYACTHACRGVDAHATMEGAFLPICFSGWAALPGCKEEVEMAD
eukprot:356209-Chlamydomonas_euryale.AAC.12